MSVSALEWPAEDLDRPAICVDQPCQDAHRRRLAGAVGSEVAVNHASRDRQVETVERAPGAVALAQATSRQSEAIRRARHAGPPGPGDGLMGCVPESTRVP